jgi:hypothetical protein
MGVIELSTKRAPVSYTVHVTQGWDGSLSLYVEDVQDDPRSRWAVADALSQSSILLKEWCQGGSK